MRDETRDRHAGATPHGRSDGGVLATGSSAPCEAAVDRRDRPATAALSMLAMTATLPSQVACRRRPRCPAARPSQIEHGARLDRPEQPVRSGAVDRLRGSRSPSRRRPAERIVAAGAGTASNRPPPGADARPSANDERRRRTRREYRAGTSADAARRHGIRAVRAGAAAGTERRRGGRGTDAEGPASLSVPRPGPRPSKTAYSAWRAITLAICGIASEISRRARPRTRP